MSRVLLVDDSPHAQRMGERILSEEGYEVVTVSNADSALIRLDDVDPDVVLADTVMPGRTGYEICQYLKMSPRHKHVRVILTAGVLENFDDDLLKRVEADSTLKKPFEATALLAAVKPLAEAAAAARTADPAIERKGGAEVERPSVAPFVAVVDAEQVRAAVTIALDGAMESIVDEIARRVVVALQAKPPAGESEPSPVKSDAAPVRPGMAKPEPPKPAGASGPSEAPAPPIMETVRRVNTLRMRSSSILGLDAETPPPPASK